MRTAAYGSPTELEFKRVMTEAGGDNGHTIYGISDSEQMEECLEEMNRLLKRYHLQLVVVDDESADYVFFIDHVDVGEKRFPAKLLISRERLLLMDALESKKRDMEWKAKQCPAMKGQLTSAQNDRLGHINRLIYLIRDGKMGIID